MDKSPENPSQRSNGSVRNRIEVAGDHERLLSVMKKKTRVALSSCGVVAAGASLMRSCMLMFPKARARRPKQRRPLNIREFPSGLAKLRVKRE